MKIVNSMQMIEIQQNKIKKSLMLKANEMSGLKLICLGFRISSLEFPHYAA